MNKFLCTTLASAILLAGCGTETKTKTKQIAAINDQVVKRVDQYRTVALEADLSALTDKQQKLISLLIEAADIADDIFWQQSFGENKDTFLSAIASNELKKYTEINYGPWDRLNNNEPFLQGIALKAAGAEFYPSNMTKEEFEQSNIVEKKSQYSLIKRDPQNNLISIPYSEAYVEPITRLSAILAKAATYAENENLAKYLILRSQALLNDDYYLSDLAWMDMKDNDIDVIIGPIETYEDQLFGYRTAFESYVLLKDKTWSKKLEKYAAYLPELQRNLPVSRKYRKEVPGSEAELNAYQLLYSTGQANAGGKTIAVNLPNDERVQLEKGTRRLQLKNAMRAKFDAIMLPMADALLVPEQKQYVTFNAFFANTMFHEVAHGLGIKNTVNGKGTVRESLKEHASPIEEGKADILGLFMVRYLLEKGVITEGQLSDYYATFLVGIFRSVRFGASSAHGKANMMRYNYFLEQKAFTRTDEGLYAVDFDKMTLAIDSLTETLLKLQGNGDYDGVSTLMKEKGIVPELLAKDLAALKDKNIPVDIIYEQGKAYLGL